MSESEYITARLYLYLKKAPKGYHGITESSASVGTTFPLTIKQMIFGFAVLTLEFALHTKQIGAREGLDLRDQLACILGEPEDRSK